MLGDSVRRRQPGGGATASQRPKKRRVVKWRVIIPSTIAALLVPFGVGYAFAVFVMFPAPKVQPGANGVVVPDLIGHTANDAAQMVSALHLGPLVPMDLPHPTAPAGQVLAQDPLPGQQLRAGSKVFVSVSNGPAQIRIPDVEGFAADAAQQVLERMGFTTNRTEEPASLARGLVTRLTPVAGSSIRLPATITMFVSAGPVATDSTGVKPDTIHTETRK